MNQRSRSASISSFSTLSARSRHSCGDEPFKTIAKFRRDLTAPQCRISARGQLAMDGGKTYPIPALKSGGCPERGVEGVTHRDLVSHLIADLAAVFHWTASGDRTGKPPSFASSVWVAMDGLSMPRTQQRRPECSLAHEYFAKVPRNAAPRSLQPINPSGKILSVR
jgi:hypothetical protein